ncbi:MAG: hypothetical protein WBP45_07340 [Daejeonella sp.]
MISVKSFDYPPADHEAEKASNSYLMSLVVVMAGLPFPIVNLLATLFFYLAHRKATFFVRWHCTQALLSQFSLVFLNSFGFWWTLSIIFGHELVSNNFIAYIMVLLIFNIAELILTIYTAINTRKGIHVEWWFYGDLTNLLCKP